MKTILEWFKPGAGVKRYVLLQIVSIALLIFCIVTLMNIKDLSPKMLISYIALITVSVFGVIFSFIIAQKNILFLSLKNLSRKNKNIGIRKLLYGDPRLKKGAKIVVIGGGSGLPNLLKGLKEYTENITAIVNVSEDDTSLSTVVANKEDLTPGDIRKCISALSTSESDLSKLLTYKECKLEDACHSLGNLIISSLIDITGSFSKAIEKLPEVFKMQGKILPVTTDNLIMCAGFENGEVIVGKQNICEMAKENKNMIKQVFLKEGSIRPNPEVIEAIKTANVIVIGPGPLYTSVVSNFLIDDVAKAIIKSKAKKVYVSNIMDQPGQTYGYTLAKYINEVERYLGKHVIDYAIANNGEITNEMLKDFNQIESSPVKVDLENIQNRAICVVEQDLVLTAKNSIIHDTDKLADIIMSITKAKKIGTLNIVKVKKKHMRKEMTLRIKSHLKKTLKKLNKSSNIKVTSKKIKSNKKTGEAKVSDKTYETINKIRNSMKKE